MAEARRGYLLVALFGLVMAGLLSLVAVYLAFLLAWVLVEILINDDARYLPLFLAAPLYFAAAVLPLRAVWLYWSVLSREADGPSLRRAGWRLLAWAAGILGALVALLAFFAEPGERLAETVAMIFVTTMLVAGPLLVLLYTRSPVGRGA